MAHDVFFCVVATLIAVGIAYAWSYSKLQGVGRDVKIASLTAVAQAIGVNYSIDVGQPPAFDRFRALKLLPSYDRSKFEDLFHGEYQGASFDLYEGLLENETKDSKGNSSYTTVFRGQIIRLAFPRKFLGVTIVRRDQGFFNMFGEDKKSNLKRVGLEDPKFEKVFEVYGTDQVEARYLVHPVLMERLMALETGMKGEKLRCGFEEGDMLIAIEDGDRYEIGDLFKPLADPERARKIVGDLSKVMQVMDSVLTAQAKRRGA